MNLIAGSQDSKEELELKIKGLEKDMQVMSLSTSGGSCPSTKPIGAKNLDPLAIAFAAEKFLFWFCSKGCACT